MTAGEVLEVWDLAQTSVRRDAWRMQMAWLQKLDRCHRRQDEVIESLAVAAQRLADQKPKPDDHEVVQAAIDYLLRSAPRHFQDEELTVFPRLVAQIPSLTAPFAEIVAQHKEQLALHQQLAATWQSPPSPEASAVLLHIALSIESLHRDHAAAEDRIFSKASSLFSAQQDQDMLTEMDSRRPHGGGGRGHGR
jgi:hemerythrin-like domain-containing protein